MNALAHQVGNPLRDRPPSSRLDVEADIEMNLGHHEAAERLSRRAEQLRMIGADRDVRRVPR